MSLTSGRVLVVDDDRFVRQLITVNLELEGFEVVTACDGVECLELVHEARPDVLTLDVVMPRLDGIATAGCLRADPRTRHLPVVMVSSYSRQEVERELGFSTAGYLGKPFDPAELVRLVRQVGAGRPGSGPAAGIPAQGAFRG